MISMPETVMRISELSRRTEISKQLIHYYLRKEYLHPPLYKKGNQAFYDETHLERLLFLKKCNQDAIPLAYASEMWARKVNVKTSRKKNYQTNESPESKTRDQIINDASQIFLSKGYNNTTIAEIMNTVGITKPSFYYYFKNKKDLYIICLDSIFEAFSRRALNSIRQEKEPLRRLEERWRAGHNHSSQLLTSINLLKESLRQDDDQRLRAEAILRKSWVDPLTRDLERGIKDGTFRPVESEIIGFALIALLDTFAYREILDQKYGQDAIFKSVFDLILHGLLNQPK